MKTRSCGDADRWDATAPQIELMEEEEFTGRLKRGPCRTAHEIEDMFPATKQQK
jgi:hypothetical protein